MKTVRRLLPVVQVALALLLGILGDMSTKAQFGKSTAWDYVPPSELISIIVNAPAALLNAMITGVLAAGPERSWIAFLGYLAEVFCLWTFIGWCIDSDAAPISQRTLIAARISTITVAIAGACVLLAGVVMLTGHWARVIGLANTVWGALLTFLSFQKLSRLRENRPVPS